MNSNQSCPYPGLRPFRREEADLFFGRGQQIDDMLTRLEEKRFLAVLGVSGCGKSSLVMAGLRPALEEGYLLGAGTGWRIAVMRPGDAPLDELAKELIKEGALGQKPDVDPVALGLLGATLRTGEKGLIKAVQETRLPEGVNLLLVVDQFEEIFRYRSQAKDVKDADAFVKLLLATTQPIQNDALAGTPIYVVITMRVDFLGDCALFIDLPERISDSLFLTPRMKRSQYQSAIEKPAQVMGGQVDEKLVNQLLNDMDQSPDALPLLQHALMRMWNLAKPDESGRKVLNQDHYEQVGRLENALSKHADEVLDELITRDKSSSVESPLPRKRLTEILFRCLCERRLKKSDIRRPVSLKDVAEVVGIGDDAIKAGVNNDKMRPLIEVIEAFRRPDRSFLTSRPESESLDNVDIKLDISHESLINKWHSLNGWVTDEIKSAEQYESLKKAANRWQENNKNNIWLWRSPEFDLALQWREKEKPNKQWAQRYGGDFELAMEFLDKSKEQQQTQKEENRRWIEDITIARSRYLALEATSEETSGELQLRLLLALESLSALKLAEEQLHTELSVPTAEEVLRQAMMASGGYCLCSYQDQHWGQINALAISPNGSWLVTGGKDGVVCRWNLSIDGRSGHSNLPESQLAKVDSDAKEGAGRNDDHGRRSYSPSVLCSDQSEIGHKGWVNVLAISPDSKWLVTGGDDTRVLLWNLEEAVPVPKTLSRDFGRIHTIIFGRCANSGYWLIVGSASPTVRLWKFSSEGQFHDQIYPLETQEWGVEALAISETGRWLVSGHDEGGTCLWNLSHLNDNPSATLEPVVLKHRSKIMIRSVVISPKEDWIVAGDNDGLVYLWKFSSNGELDKQLIPLNEHKRDKQPISIITISPDNHWLIAGDLGTKEKGEGNIYLWELSAITANQEPTLKFSSHANWISALAISSDSRWLVTAGGDNIARRWDLNNLDRPPLILHGHEKQIRVAAFTYDNHGNQWVFTGSDDGAVRKWDLLSRSATYPIILSGHKYKEGAIWTLAVSPDNKWLVTGGKDKTALLWGLTKKDILADPLVLNPKSEIPDVAFRYFKEETWLITSHDNGTVLLWNLKLLTGQDAGTDRKPDFILHGHDSDKGKIWMMSLSSDKRWLVTGTENKTACLWDLSTIKPKKLNKPFKILKGHQSAVWAVAISPNNKWLVTGGEDGTARLWKFIEITEKSEAIPFVLDPHAWGIHVVLFDEEKWLITGHDDGTIRLWNLELLTDQDAGTKPQPDFILRGHNIGDETNPTRARIWTMALSSNNRWLVTGSEDKTACLWDLSSLPSVDVKPYTIKPYAVLSGHKGRIRAVIISENRWLYTGSEDGDICRWDIEAIKPDFNPEWIVIGEQQSPVIIMAISSDNYWLVSGGEDGVARLWNLRLDELKKLAYSMVGRNLTQKEWDKYFYKQSYHKTCHRYPFPHTVMQEKIKEVKSSLEKGNIEPVLDLYQKTEEFEIKSVIIELVLKQAESFAKVNNKDKADEFYKQAVAWGSKENNAAMMNSAICRSGSIYGFAEIVLPAGERAVSLDNNNPAFHDSYGLALALTKRHEEAAGELAFYEKWLKEFKDGFYAYVIDYKKEYFERRHKWINDLINNSDAALKHDFELLKQRSDAQLTSNLPFIQARGSGWLPI